MNRFTAALPADKVSDATPRQVHQAVYSFVAPVICSNPRLLSYSKSLAADLGLSASLFAEKGARLFTGAELFEGSEPHALCYGGHQFGSWAGQLGDGRAINLGELQNKAGALQMLQLKGAGPTPYSRRADGFAVLRSSLREYVCSEAMHALGVPTTRALSIALTGDEVLRDMLYDGNSAEEPGAVVCRVAPSFLRIGNFELFAQRGEKESLQTLLDFTLHTYFSHLGEPSVEAYEQWFDEVAQKTAELMVEWMRIGFVHGVMNTDNMSIHGLTIDYGPYGWLEEYDLGWTPNTTDAARKRYRFGNQPPVAQWNLLQLANALYPLIGRVSALEASVNKFSTYYETLYRSMMLKKLGLFPLTEEKNKSTSEIDELLTDLHSVMAENQVDMTLFFRSLSKVKADTEDAQLLKLMDESFYLHHAVSEQKRSNLQKWLLRYQTIMKSLYHSDTDRVKQMERVNPLYIFRNYIAQEVIDSTTAGEYGPLAEVIEVLKNPYEEQRGKEKFAAKRPRWADDKPGCSMLSCSS